MKFKPITAGLTAILLVCGLTGCQNQTNPTETIRVCEVTHSIFYAPQYVALEKGFFSEEGLEVELSNGGGADKVMSAVLSDHIDIGFAGPEASIYVYNEGKSDFTQVFAQVTKRDGSFLVGREPDPDFTWHSLAGKHILPRSQRRRALIWHLMHRTAAQWIASHRGRTFWIPLSSLTI